MCESIYCGVAYLAKIQMSQGHCNYWAMLVHTICNFQHQYYMTHASKQHNQSMLNWCNGLTLGRHRRRWTSIKSPLVWYQHIFWDVLDVTLCLYGMIDLDTFITCPLLLSGASRGRGSAYEQNQQPSKRIPRLMRKRISITPNIKWPSSGY